MKIVVQTVHPKPDPTDYSEFEALKQSLAAELDDTPCEDVYADFLRFVMSRAEVAQRA